MADEYLIEFKYDCYLGRMNSKGPMYMYSGCSANIQMKQLLHPASASAEGVIVLASCVRESRSPGQTDNGLGLWQEGKS